jgi:hypothetical protein
MRLSAPLTARGLRVAAAAGFKVYPPGQIRSKVVPFLFQGCARSGRSNVVVRAIGLSGRRRDQ